MSPDELRAWVLELRALRDTPSAFRNVVKVDEEENSEPKKSVVDDLLL